MRTKETTVYQFDELSDKAKDTARTWYLSGMNASDFGADTVLEDAARMADILGLNIRQRPVKLMGGGTRQEPDVYWSVGNRDDGVSFSGYYHYGKGSVAKIAAEAPAEWDGKVNESNKELNRIAQTLQDVQRRNFYQLTASIGHGRNFNMTIDVERADRNYPSAEDCETVTECLKDFATWMHRQLEREYEYQSSNEVIDETIRANEYEFNEDGNRE